MKTDLESRKLRFAASVAALFAPALVVLCYRGIARHPHGEPDPALIGSMAAPLRPERDFPNWQRLGSNAVPALTEALHTKPRTLDKAYGLVWSNLPPAAQSNLPPPLDAERALVTRTKASALLAQAQIGDHVSTATLIEELNDPYWGVRMNALACLNNIVLPNSGPKALGDDQGKILNLVLAAAQNQQMEVRMSAVYCLGYFKESTGLVIPVLSKALTDDYPDVRIRAAMAFYRIDRVQAEKAGALSTASDCAQYENGPYGSKWLATDFLKKESNRPNNEPR